MIMQRLTKYGILIAVVVLLIDVLVIAGPSILTAIMALPLVLFLPGFGMSALLFKREQLGFAERILLSVGLSVAITALVGLALNWTPWGLSPTALWIALLVVLAVECIAILIFRRKLTYGFFGAARSAFTLRQGMLLGLAAVVTIVALFVARTPVQQKGFAGYTTLWIQASNTPDMVRIGVDSEEFATTKYQIRFELNQTIHDGPTLELKPGESWEGLLEVPSDQLAGKSLTVFLYRLDQPDEVYRHVVWWPE